MFVSIGCKGLLYLCWLESDAKAVCLYWLELPLIQLDERDLVSVLVGVHCKSRYVYVGWSWIIVVSQLI